jgi:REP element-mobilizing transposase RayT
MGDMRSGNRIFVGKNERKFLFGRYRSRLGRILLKEITEKYCTICEYKLDLTA